ncbi:MAG: DUF1559 domain-containing protein [Planctomycetes bacterium]|nr:DUF1559 domain-containing protein [Planctomycetota bacterium]
MVEFECPSCRQKLNAELDYAGQTIACPECAAQVVIPASAGAITAAPTAGPAKTDAITTPDQYGLPSTPDTHEETSDHRSVTLPDHHARGGMSVILIASIVGVVVLCIGGTLVGLMGPAFWRVHEAAARAEAMNNMKQIGVGLHEFHDRFKHFPPPRMQKPDWNLSWRVAILPVIDLDAMFTRVAPEVGWDHPNNANLLNSRPAIYDHRLRPLPDTPETLHQYFTGPNTLFPTPHARARLAHMKGMASNTFMFAEAQTAVPWMKPADMAVTPNDPLPLPPDRFLVCFATAHVRMFERTKVSDEVLRALIDQGQQAPPEE